MHKIKSKTIHRSLNTYLTKIYFEHIYQVLQRHIRQQKLIQIEYIVDKKKTEFLDANRLTINQLNRPMKSNSIKYIVASVSTEQLP